MSDDYLGWHRSAADPYKPPREPRMSDPVLFNDENGKPVGVAIGKQSDAGPGVEWKVKAATAGSYVGGVVALAFLQAITDGYFLAALPEPWTTVLAPLLPALITFVTGYVTKHTPRTSGLGAEVDALVALRVAEAVDKMRGELGIGESGGRS